MKVYLDMCCIKRPFDDQLQARIHLETVAMEGILLAARNRSLSLVASDALRFENSRNPNEQRRDFAAHVLVWASETIANSPHIERRAAAIQSLGISLLDSLHLASAEYAKVDVFCTCDEDLLKKARRVALGVRAVSPAELLQEVAP